MIAGIDDVGSLRVLQGNPFPGLRPFEPHESSLFFGRDDQCDDLLSRLGRRRLVAVVGMSGSGKSSLVRAGLLPALDRGYLPSAGSSWHIAIFRPGSDPVANLTRGLVTRRLPGGGEADDDPGEVRKRLDASSLGLVAAARTLLPDSADSLLIVADQFEELFRFGRIATDERVFERATACVDLLLNASQQDEVPVYVVLTMRSDYLGDCAHFTGLPEALNDSQFLVPRMTRAQLREAIECPVAVGGAQITPRLVQRLLHEIDEIPSGSESAHTTWQGQDQLPVLQHALMRMWDVSRTARERGEPIDLPHYEQPPVETLRHALDRHAEEVYQELPSDLHRDVARLVFQQLTDRDAENREVRRPTQLVELAAVAIEGTARAAAPADERVVNEVLAAFSAPGRAFVVVNAQQDVDISHESFIRRWTRLHEWVERESRSRRVYAKLADAAASWERKEASLYRGPELAEARRWWERETPTPSWANRYDSRFEVAHRFLMKGVRTRRVRLGLISGNIAALVVGAAAIAVLMVNRADEARRAAFEVRNATEISNRRLEEANRLFKDAIALQQEGKSGQAAELVKQAQQVQEAKAAPALTPSELSELDRLRREADTWRQTETNLRNQLAAAAASPAQKSEPSAAERAEAERLRDAVASANADSAQLRQQLAAANERAAKSQQAESALRESNQLLQAQLDQLKPKDTRAADTSDIERVLSEYAAAYRRRDAEAVVKVMPSAKSAELAKNFSQYSAYEMEILDTRISVTGDTAVADCTRRVAFDPKVGSRQTPRPIPTRFRLKRANGAWTIESVEERRGSSQNE
jgi:hypothetical protein